MACNESRQQCNPRDVIAGAASQGCSGFMDPGNFQGEQLIYDLNYSDLINSYGVPINYYVNTYNLSSAENFYGDHVDSVYTQPVSLKMYLELTENAITLSKFGFRSDDELTGYVHIQTFIDTMSALINYSSFGQRIEPKSGDVIEVSVLGCDRPGLRGAKWFEITERVDQDTASINPLMGHYVWRVRAKRYEHTFQPGLTGERGNNQVYDNTFSGTISANSINAPISQDKTYPGNVDTTSQTDVFDMDVNDNTVYGRYY